MGTVGKGLDWAVRDYAMGRSLGPRPPGDAEGRSGQVVTGRGLLSSMRQAIASTEVALEQRPMTAVSLDEVYRCLLRAPTRRRASTPPTL